MKQMFVIIMLFLCSSCLDQVDKYYPDYNSIISEGFEKAGWIPESLLPASKTNFYSRTNVDINSFMISYRVNSHDLEVILSQLELSNENFVKPHGLNIPKWWFKNTNPMDTYKLRSDSSIGTFAVDNSQKTIYYWGKFK